MPLILENVCMQFADRSVLRKIDLEIRDDETVAIMGPSGSGKTTLLSILGLLLDPTSGSVIIDGKAAPRRERDRHPIRSHSFGWVLQTVNVMGRRTAAENVAIPLLSAGQSQSHAHRQALSALTQVGLGARWDTPVRWLSGGEVQRVCIARALAHQPRYLLADEPTGQLDDQTSATVIEALWELRAKTRSTLVIATHDPKVAEACARIVYLVDGKARPQ